MISSADMASPIGTIRVVQPAAAAGIKPYLDMGFTHLVIHGPGDDQARFISQFAQDVMPRLR